MIYKDYNGGKNMVERKEYLEKLKKWKEREKCRNSWLILPFILNRVKKN